MLSIAYLLLTQKANPFLDQDLDGLEGGARSVVRIHRLA